MDKNRKRKLGLFNNAKYSRPVFRNASDKVVIAARKDIEMMIRPEPDIEIQKWTNAPIISSQMSQRNPMNIFSQSSQNVFRKNPTFKKPSLLPNENNINSTIFNSPKQTKTDSLPKFPVEPILHDIARNMINTFPQLTLKNDATMEYTEAAVELVKKALVTNINKSISYGDENAENPAVSTTALDAPVADVYTNLYDNTTMYDENDDDDFEIFEANEGELNDEDPFFQYNDVTEFNNITQDEYELNHGSPFFEQRSMDTSRNFNIFSSQLKSDDLFNQTNNNLYDESLFFDC